MNRVGLILLAYIDERPPSLPLPEPLASSIFPFSFPHGSCSNGSCSIGDCSPVSCHGAAQARVRHAILDPCRALVLVHYMHFGVFAR